MKKTYQSLFISDLHLGSSFNKSEKLFELLENIVVKRIFLIGDIIDITASQEHPDVIKFATLLDSKSWEVIYLSGNHEDDRKRTPPISISLEKKLFPLDYYYIYENDNNRVYLEHGHTFHEKNLFNIILKRVVIYLKLKVFRKIKKSTRKKGQRKDNFYYTKIKPIAQKLLINSFQSYMVSCAKKNECNIVICGHFHIPNSKNIKNIHYLNCGDWLEHSSFIVEEINGEFNYKYL